MGARGPLRARAGHRVGSVAALAGVLYGLVRRMRGAGPAELVPVPADVLDPAVRLHSLAHRPAVDHRRPSLMRARLLLGTVGGVGVLFGAYGILSQPSRSHPGALLVWLAAAVALHDGVLVPATLLLGAIVSRTVPLRARHHVQGALVSAALITAVGLPLVHRRGSAPASKALLTQDYATHLLAIVAVLTAGAALAHGVRRLRDRRARAGNR